jgi:hypothetical protein
MAGAGLAPGAMAAVCAKAEPAAKSAATKIDVRIMR